MFITENVLYTKVHNKQWRDGIPNPGKTSSHTGNVSLLPFLSSSFYVLLVEIVLYGWSHLHARARVLVCVSIHSPTYVSTISFNQQPFMEVRGHQCDLDFIPGKSINRHSCFLKKGVGSAVYISKSQKAITLWASNTAFGVFP